MQTEFGQLDWIDARQRSRLKKIGFSRVGEALYHLPRRYEDRRQFDQFPTEETPEALCLHARVADTQWRFWRGGRRVLEVELHPLEENAFSGAIYGRWFNAPYLAKQIAVDQELVLYGKVKKSGKRLLIDHPDFEIIEPGAESSIHFGRITPIYPAVSGVGQRLLRGLIYRLTELLPDSELPAILPSGAAALTRAEALRTIHFPDSRDAISVAKRELALEEFYLLQLRVLLRRQEMKAQVGTVKKGGSGLVSQFIEQLPFALTGAQKKALAEIESDLRSEQPMNRLLQGDVGSGKTVVALASMLHAVGSGTQAALMAPTQILAEQHYLNFQSWLEPLGVRVALRTSGRKEENNLPLWHGDSAPSVVVGTHALLFEEKLWNQLGLVVIDEQHKFGVRQRARLIARGQSPDVLVMTATPIPRTLTMTLYGDLDVSVLDELPAGRGALVTGVRPESKLDEAAHFVREQIEGGRQAYIVFPLVEESESLQAKAATKEFALWQEMLAPHLCSLIHGRLSPEEKEDIMERFRAGETKALIATTVIEVGVDVPNANVMVVHNAERFGLAQLHQLRGRIGRGEHKSYCVLLVGAKGAKSEVARDKLQVLAQSSDGFRIAEADLKLRGPGDLLGTAQSGLPAMRAGDLLEDFVLLQKAKELAQAVLCDDPQLTAPENRAASRALRELAAQGEVLAEIS